MKQTRSKPSAGPVIPPGMIALDTRNPEAVLSYIAARVREARVDVVIVAARPGGDSTTVYRGDRADAALMDVLKVATTALQMIRGDQRTAAGSGG